jgi:membrane protein insertase Oxa1/YidC/SpoIIIJ
MTAPSTDPQGQSMNQTMQVMMPLMLGFFSLQFSSGLALYFVISNVVGVVIQYFTPGWVGVSFGRKKAQPATASIPSSRPTLNLPTGNSKTTESKAGDEGPDNGDASEKGQQRYGKKRRKRRS